jgi:threonine/homoserine/homoserine lactone efflux protein
LFDDVEAHVLPEIGLSGLLSLLTSAAALMASPGPATLSVAAMAAAYGFRRSLSYVMGINLGTILVLLAMALGASTLLYALPGLALPISIAASLYILYLAYRIATTPPLTDKTNEPSPGLIPGLLLAMANPKAYLAIGAVYSKAVLIPSDAVADAILKCVILSAAILVIHALWALAGSALTGVLHNRKASRVVNLILAAALVLVVVAEYCELTRDRRRSRALYGYSESRFDSTGKVGVSYTWRPKGSSDGD